MISRSITISINVLSNVLSNTQRPTSNANRKTKRATKTPQVQLPRVGHNALIALARGSRARVRVCAHPLHQAPSQPPYRAGEAMSRGK
ncbi:hypothetical protein BDW22DRAFT_1355974 [Trametopsis cervina]|nr:hypothetical protein BDW22DRAFT_1355974 [Trametopsis cervina]